MDKRPPVVLQTLPFSEACERNKAPILEVLAKWLAGPPRVVVEIGAGTGQHAVYFARQLPHLTWQPTEQAEHLTLLDARVTSVRFGSPSSPASSMNRVEVMMAPSGVRRSWLRIARKRSCVCATA